MDEKVDDVFNYGGKWALTPQVNYIKKLTHIWKEYDPDLLSYIDLCSEYTEQLCFSKVKQLLCLGPSDKYYLVEGDSGFRTLQNVLSTQSNVLQLQLFVVEEGEDYVLALDISQLNEPYPITVDAVTNCDINQLNESLPVTVDTVINDDINQLNEVCLVTIDAVTDGESSEEEKGENEPFASDHDSDELEFFRREKKREVTEKLDNFLELEKGMSFKNLDEAKRIVSYYSIVRKRGLRVVKSDSTRLRYKCDIGCPFLCLISEVKKGQGFEIKTLETKHTCQEAFKNKRATQQALSHYFKNKVQNNPKYKVKDMRKDVDDHFSLNITYSKMKRVKRLILEKLEGSFIDDFNKLEAYAQELRNSNPGSDVVINISKDAWNKEKEDFQEWKCKGILLVALGQDSVKHFYPLAWAVADRETTRTWKWFIELLRNSLDLKDGEGFTFMSDMQKGLIGVVGQLLPKAHHRWCVRHIEANWTKTWRGVEMKKLLWWSAWSTYVEEFQDQLKTMGSMSEQAPEDLLWYPAQHWCRAYFDTICKNQACENNFIESFNKWILEARSKPIIKMLEDIRIKVMNRLKDLEEEGKKWTRDFSPYAMDLYKDYKIIAHGCHVQSNGDLGYEVAEGVDTHVVSLVRKKCTCRTWDLTGIPCPHAIKALEHDKKEPLDEMNWWYSKEAYILVYQHKFNQLGVKDSGKCIPLMRWSHQKYIKCAPGHNKRNCPLLERRAQVLPDVPLSAPQSSQESVFMSIPGFVPSPSVQTSQPSIEVAGPSNLKRKAKDKNVAFIDEDELESEDENETAIIRP
ncbi:hypothetical protein MTR67_026562 [Solanum verrucosum]|uniref:SWIM-type domain-containing protein n=1 Tax=Solanum verrucosum TaxID=315347 RepID=A0AAF0QZ65_SOLVR|nr:hypothetical protein MTR67_026562 [Solanum verrucosum]